MEKYCDQCMESHEGKCNLPADYKESILRLAFNFGGYEGSLVENLHLSEVERWKEMHCSGYWIRVVSFKGFSALPYEAEFRAAFNAAFDKGIAEEQEEEKKAQVQRMTMKIDDVFASPMNRERLAALSLTREMLRPSEDGASIVARVYQIPSDPPYALRHQRKYQADEFIPLLWEQA